MGPLNNFDPIFFYLNLGKSATRGGFDGVVTPSGKKQVQKYVSRRKEPKKRYRRRSTFGVGLDGEKWVNYLEQYSDEVEQLMKLTPSKRRFYQQGMRAATLIQSIS